MFTSEDCPFILTIAGTLKMMGGGEKEYVQSFKVERKTVHASTLTNVDNCESIVDNYYITHTIVKLLTA